MQLRFLQLPPEERRLYFEQAAAQRNISSVILEKDFWVCWLLGVLFNSPFAGSLVFKGGTSLSKVFNAIERFSEDLDLSLSPAFLNISEQEVEPGASQNKLNAWMKKAQAACADQIRDVVQPEIERLVEASLGRRNAGKKWLSFEFDQSTKSPVLLFEYPTTQGTGFEYLRRSVKLEFGSLTDQQPTGQHSVKPWIAETYHETFDDWHCDVVALEVERTFWEKATILHSEHHRPDNLPMPDRFSRHYADTAALANSSIAHAALADSKMRNRVVTWKSRFFPRAWARYDLARPGTFKLVPPNSRLSALHADYEAMRDMYLSEPVAFDNIISTLAELAVKINQSAAEEPGT